MTDKELKGTEKDRVKTKDEGVLIDSESPSTKVLRDKVTTNPSEMPLDTEREEVASKGAAITPPDVKEVKPSSSEMSLDKIVIQFTSKQMQQMEKAIKYQTVSNILLVVFGISFLAFMLGIMFQVDVNNYLSRITIALEALV